MAEQAEKTDASINVVEEEKHYRKINITRYVDWAITTPIMLLVLILF